MVWAIAQCLLPNGNLNVDMLAMFANGFAAAIYVPLFYFLRGGTRNSVMGGLLIAMGVLHFVWDTLGTGPIVFCLRSAGVGDVRWENAAMYLVTGLGYAAATGWASRSFRPALAILLGTVASTLACRFGDRDMIPGLALNEIGTEAAPLHISIATGLLIDTFTWIRNASPRPHDCARCGYDLTGTAGGVCPECGLGQR